MNAARGMERQQRRTAWIFLLPLLLTLAAVAIWPLARSIFFSFTDALSRCPFGLRIRGFREFREVAEDPVFLGRGSATRSSSRW